MFSLAKEALLDYMPWSNARIVWITGCRVAREWARREKDNLTLNIMQGMAQLAAHQSVAPPLAFSAPGIVQAHTGFGAVAASEADVPFSANIFIKCFWAA